MKMQYHHQQPFSSSQKIFLYYKIEKVTFNENAKKGIIAKQHRFITLS